MRLNWSSLTKEQKQYAFLLVVGLVILGSLLYAFAIIPLQEGAERRQAENDALREKLIKADLALKHEVRAKTEGEQKRAQLDELTNSAVAPFGNAFAWVTEQLYVVAKETGVEVEGLNGNSQPLGSSGPAAIGSRSFVAFTVQLIVPSSYADMLHFLRVLEEKNPTVTVTSLTIDRNEATPGRQRVSLALDWPTWARDPAAPPPPAKPGKP